MAALTAQQLSAVSGLAATYAAAGGSGDTISNNSGKMILHVKNGSASPITVTITAVGTLQGFPVTNPTYTVANAGEKFIGPFDPSIFNNTSGAVAVGYSATTTVTVAVLQIP